MRFGSIETHDTKDEIAFLNGIGTWSENTPDLPEQVPAPVRLELLLRYLDSMELRSEWGSINPDEVRKHVESMISHLKLEVA